MRQHDHWNMLPSFFEESRKQMPVATSEEDYLFRTIKFLIFLMLFD